MIENIHWLGHDSFRIDAGGVVIYTDPFRIKKPVRADLVLITHEHYDHCSPEDVEKIVDEKTVILAPPDCAQKFSKGKVKIVKPGGKLDVMGVEIEVVPAYNINKKFHPKQNQWVGYIFTAGGKRIYMAGDTDHIPEMKEFRADIALLPVSGTYVMTAEEAARAALDIRPEIAVPMHYGTIVGTEDDADRFAKKSLEGKVKTAILKNEGPAGK
ncbi:MAG: MBL fold metallo-hydrolase [Nitrospiraceae bacterium]|nr:MBL fold metallo-hydrolase [Nitrospiraceae bacterium]